MAHGWARGVNVNVSPEVLLMDAVSALDITGAANEAESKQSNVVHGYLYFVSYQNSFCYHDTLFFWAPTVIQDCSMAE